MRSSPCNTFRLVLVCALIAGFCGFLAGRQSINAPALPDEIARLQAQVDTREPAPRSYPPINLSRLAAPRPSSAGDQQTQPEPSEEQLRKKIGEEFFKSRIDAWVASEARNRSDEYTLVLSELGLDQEEIGKVEARLVELHEKAITAGEPMGELAVARSEYDKMMRSLFNDEDYERYRAYETSKPAFREYALLEEYALSTHGLTLDPAQAQEIIPLMTASGATTTETWHGPYDPLPRPIAGSAAIEDMAARNTALVDNANRLLQTAAAIGMSEEGIGLLESYYTHKVEEAHQRFTFFNRPREEIIADIHARIRAMSESPPQP